MHDEREGHGDDFLERFSRERFSRDDFSCYSKAYLMHKWASHSGLARSRRRVDELNVRLSSLTAPLPSLMARFCARFSSAAAAWAIAPPGRYPASRRVS